MNKLEIPFDADYIVNKSKHITRELKKEIDTFGLQTLTKKIAVLGGSTTSDIVKCLEVFLLDNGIEATFYESDYGKYFEDSIFSNMELDEFSPDIIYIHTSNRNILEWPNVTDEIDDVETKLLKVYNHFEQIWESLRERFNCVIIQNNMELPFFRLLGNRDVSDFHGRVNFVGRINEKFNDYARAHDYFHLNDINYLSAMYGLEKWSEPFYWYMYKYSLCISAIPILAKSISNIIKAVYGKNKKVITVDLDNTLWGGVIGDDGIENIELGQETAIGQAYQEFQEYLKLHKEMGILLTVSSKNELSNALAGLSHENSKFKLEDFLVIKANWENKSKNILEIADELRVLPDSIVFIDDNPAEREIVKNENKNIATPYISSVEKYIQEIDRQGYFEVVNFSNDDLSRNSMYSLNLKRQREVSKYNNYDEYLFSLEMKAQIKTFHDSCISRITQLTNKSNQFNLTTKRYSYSELEKISKDTSYLTLYGRLEDKFGDNGIVSIIIGQISHLVCHIDLWLMSCRVLKRNMEIAMLDKLIKDCSEKGIHEIVGYYYPTPKNNMVKDFYKQQGFTLINEYSNGNTEWSLKINDNYYLRNKVIEVEE